MTTTNATTQLYRVHIRATAQAVWDAITGAPKLATLTAGPHPL